MAAITQIKLNSTNTTYDINDKRISTTAVDTVSYVLGSANSSLSTISPITTANLASVLGVVNLRTTTWITESSSVSSLEDVSPGLYAFNYLKSWLPSTSRSFGLLVVIGSTSGRIALVATTNTNGTEVELYYTACFNGFNSYHYLNWVKIY